MSDSQRIEAAARAIIERWQRSDVTNTCADERQWNEARKIAAVALRAADGVREDTATTEHPTLDGRPVLLGDRVRATDDEFTIEGIVTSVMADGEAVYVTVRPDLGFSEEFILPSAHLAAVSSEGTQ